MRKWWIDKKGKKWITETVTYPAPTGIELILDSNEGYPCSICDREKKRTAKRG